MSGTSAKHCTLMVPLSTQVYKQVPVNLVLGVTVQWTSIPSRGSLILLDASCYRNRDKFKSDGPFACMQTLNFYFFPGQGLELSCW